MQIKIRKRKTGGKTNYFISMVKYEDGQRVLNQTLSVRKYLGLNRPAEFKDAQKVVTELQAESSKGHLIKESSRSLEGYVEEWLGTQELYLKGTSLNTYRHILQGVIDVEGNRKLKDLTPAILRKVFKGMSDRGLNNNTIGHCHTILKKCLSDAVTDGLIRSNPMERIKKPRSTKPQVKYLAWSDAQKLIKGTEGERHCLYVCIALTTGMCRGEILGLKWEDIDFKGKSISVRNNCVPFTGGAIIQTTKTKNRTRTLDVSPWLLSKIQEHKNRQVLEQEALGYKNEENLVFVSTTGEPVNPNFMLSLIKRWYEKLGVTNVGTHGLRHTYATRLLELGVHPKVVSERLGHSSINMTINTYSHVTPRLAREVAGATDPE